MVNVITRDQDNKKEYNEDYWNITWRSRNTSDETWTTLNAIPCEDLINSLSDIGEDEKRAMIAEVPSGVG